MSVSDSLPVILWHKPDVYEIGQIKFRRDDVILELESGKNISGRSFSDIYYEPRNKMVLNEKGQSMIVGLESRIKIQLKPTFIVSHPYTNQGGQFVEDVFPPSTNGFYGRLQAGKNEALYTVQRIEDSEQFWLTITNPVTNQIYETQMIQPYEAEALSLIEDRIRRILYGESSGDSEKRRDEILSILDSSSPSWQELEVLLRDVSIPNLHLGTTMRDTLSQIVPPTYPPEIREELMAFLAYVVRDEIPKDDPMTYLYRFSSMIILEDLLSNHLTHVIDETEWPPYVRLMTLAARGQLEAPKRAISDWIMKSPWFLFNEKCVEMRPNWLSIAVSSAKTLNDTKRIVVGLPTTKSAAKKSKASWKKRFAEISYGLRIRGHIDSTSLSLIELVYLGSAYRWSHRHMKFIARLGSINENPPYLQVMLMPKSAAERVKRTLPSILSVAWSARTSNFELFDDRTSNWIVPTKRIVDSLEKKSSMKKLMRKFGNQGIPKSYSITKKEARVADLVAEGVESMFFEVPEFLKNWGLTQRTIHSSLAKLVNRNILSVNYEVVDTRLISVATYIQGGVEAVSSLASEFLESTPTSYVRINQSGENCIVLTRLPEETVHSFASQLTSKGMEYDMNIRCMRPTTFRRYTSNLYQRLLKEDGTWDDDVSAFLSQARSKRKELSESNA